MTIQLKTKYKRQSKRKRDTEGDRDSKLNRERNVVEEKDLNIVSFKVRHKTNMLNKCERKISLNFRNSKARRKRARGR